MCRLSPCCRLVLSSSSHCATLSSSNRAGWLLRRLSLCRRLILSLRHTLVLSLRRPLVISLRCLVVVFLWNYVLEKALEEDLLPMPNFTERHNKDRAVVPPTSLATVVIGVGLVIASQLPSPPPWMLLLALQSCRRRHPSCRLCQCPFHCPPPSPTLVAITITITLTLFVAIAITRPPTLSLSL